MRKIRDDLDLSDKIETITAMELRKTPGEVLDSVRFGKTFILTKQGKPVGVLSPLPGRQLTVIVHKDGSKDYKL